MFSALNLSLGKLPAIKLVRNSFCSSVVKPSPAVEVVYLPTVVYSGWPVTLFDKGSNTGSPFASIFC
jgi:hypothetical protein